jgi:SynChlorMet cassette protein ScmD
MTIKKDFPIANPVVVLREEFDDWAVLFNPDTAKAVGINPIGVLIWKLLDGSHTFQDIVRQIKKRFSAVPRNALKETKEYIAVLVKEGFVGFELQGKR